MAEKQYTVSVIGHHTGSSGVKYLPIPIFRLFIVSPIQASPEWTLPVENTRDVPQQGFTQSVPGRGFQPRKAELHLIRKSLCQIKHTPSRSCHTWPKEKILRYTRRAGYRLVKDANILRDDLILIFALGSDPDKPLYNNN